MQASPARHRYDRSWLLYVSLSVLGLLTCRMPVPAVASPLRRSAIVLAVEQAKPSIVSINGHKTVHSNQNAQHDATRRVNGMGTGVVIDERGYIITNYHVVEGVRQINVTTSDERTFIAKLVAHDPYTDLAIIKIPVKKKLPLIKVGSSSDLMQGERVVAIGNAYGYHHTVTCGFISALSRSVHVNDAQKYYDLIQTDASINPGNSGGPLLNIDGEMIGINVAVRVGAQGIGFAIPADKAMEVAGELMSVERLKGLWHGVEGRSAQKSGMANFVVSSVREGSPAANSGIQPGDVIRTVEDRDIHNQLDLERALLDTDAGDTVSLHIERNQEPLTMNMVMASIPQKTLSSTTAPYWNSLGMRLVPVSHTLLRQLGSTYNGGLRVAALRRDGPAARQGIRPGDVLVGMHRWETVSLDNVKYILNRPDLRRAGKVKFYIVRGSETLYGHLPIMRR